MEVNAKRARHLLQCLGPSQSSVLRQCAVRDPLPDNITYLEEAQLIRAACDAASDVTFAAKSGLTLLESGTVISYIAKHSKTLRKAIENTARFHELIDPALMYSLRISGNAASVEFNWKDSSFEKFHRRTEFLMFAVLSRLRFLAQNNFYPIQIRFGHIVGESSAPRYSRVGSFPVVFGAERTEILLPLSALDLPIPTYDPTLRDHLTTYSEQLLNEMGKSQPTLRARVEKHIMASLPGYMPPAQEVAATLGLSGRTFARQLKDDATSYRVIVDDLRYDLAKTFIKDDMRLSEIAFVLGYSDQAAFSTAFKRWSGNAPSNLAK